MRRASWILTLVAMAGMPVVSEAGSIEIRGGGFLPRADSNLFADNAELYVKDGQTLEKSDWNGFTGGAQFNAGLTDNVEIGFSVDGYERTLNTSYRDFVGESGREIRQSLKLQVVPVGVQIRLGPTGRGKLSPYVAGGADLIFYRYEEFGEFIDFFDPDNPIIDDSFISEGVAPGFHVAGGVRVPVGDDFGVNVEGRYQWAKHDMGDDFAGNEIDLSGASITVGLHIRF